MSNEGESAYIIKTISPCQLLNINYFQECITFELSVKYDLGIITAFYRSPSQSHWINKL